MKKIIAACIYQVIQFDNDEEFKNYISKLDRDKQKYKVEDVKGKDEKITIKIIKQYNNNKFVERGEINES